MAPYKWVVRKMVGGGGQRHGAVQKQHSVVANSQRFGDVVIGQHDCGAPVGERAQQVAEALGPRRIDPGERFVAHEQARRSGHRTCELQTAAFAGRQLAGANPKPVFEPDPSSGQLGVLGRLPRDFPECVEVVADR
jgi:hypothetical protein